MKRWILCLFTYNRYDFLVNAVRSIDTFFPWGDRLVIDDGSSDPRVHRFLEELAEKSNWTYKIMDRMDRSYGGYYNNMRFALDHALEKGYDRCFFFEDDEQLVWKKDDFLESVDHVFDTCPDAIQIQHLFARRIIPYHQVMEYIASAQAYRTNRGFSTSAIWNLDVVRRHPDYRFICIRGDDLPANSAYWLERGYRLYYQFDPPVAILPWVETKSLSFGASAKKKSSEVTQATSGFLLKPITASQIEFLRHRSPTIPPYQEYFDLSPENNAGPIWHQRGNNLKRLYYLCRQIVKEEDHAGQSPLPVPVLESWVPTKIPSLESHLNCAVMYQETKKSSYKNKLPLGLRLWIRWMLSWRQFNLINFIGYLRLKKRLRQEQRAIFNKL